MTHAILITWRNMSKVTVSFKARAEKKYEQSFHEIFFDGDAAGELKKVVQDVKAEEKLKVYICGHGGTGIEYIADDTHSQKKTIVELIDLLVFGLQPRKTFKESSGDTAIVMLSCLFGRTADGHAKTTPATKLHLGLTQKDVFVDLIARTESISMASDVNRTISVLDEKVYERDCARKSTIYLPKTPHTKVRHTFNKGAPVSAFATYDVNNPYIEQSDVEAREILWADYVINELVAVINLKRKDDGTLEVVAAREKVLKDIISHYQVIRKPKIFHDKLAVLVDANNTETTIEKNFLIHRTWNPLRSNDSLPNTARLIKTLIAAYPDR